MKGLKNYPNRLLEKGGSKSPPPWEEMFLKSIIQGLQYTYFKEFRL